MRERQYRAGGFWSNIFESWSRRSEGRVSVAYSGQCWRNMITGSISADSPVCNRIKLKSELHFWQHCLLLYQPQQNSSNFSEECRAYSENPCLLSASTFKHVHQTTIRFYPSLSVIQKHNLWIYFNQSNSYAWKKPKSFQFTGVLSIYRSPFHSPNNIWALLIPESNLVSVDDQLRICAREGRTDDINVT